MRRGISGRRMERAERHVNGTDHDERLIAISHDDNRPRRTKGESPLLESGGEVRVGFRLAGRRTAVIIWSGEQKDLEVARLGEPGIDQAGSRTNPNQDSGKPHTHSANLRERVRLFKADVGVNFGKRGREGSAFALSLLIGSCRSFGGIITTRLERK